ncbi:MAG: hypothetical protein IJY20_07295 [Clostridia bacterium]|nr:hypothetical protein [Clostridia bacterium]
MRCLRLNRVCALLFAICLAFSFCFLLMLGPLAAADAVTDELASVPFSSCVPDTLTAGKTVSFLNGWEPVTGDVRDSHFSYTATMGYYTGAKLMVDSTAKGSYRPSNGRFELLTDGRAIGAMYTAPESGTVSISMDALTGVRSLQTLASHQEQITVGGTTYYAYYLKNDSSQIYYTTTGGSFSGQPSGGWFRYDAATGRMKAVGTLSGSFSIAYPTAAFSYDIAITLNGKVIWPSNGGFWHYEGSVVDHTARSATEDMLAALPAGDPLPSDLRLSRGDQLAFVALCNAPSNNYLVMEPVVGYTSIGEPPALSVEAGISMNDRFAVNYFVAPVGEPSSCGILWKGETLVGQKQPNGKYLVTFGGIAAKNLGDAITVTPYQVLDDEMMTAESITISPAELLMCYVTEETAGTAVSDLAIAMLNYGAAAQTYFDYAADTPVNAALTEEQRARTYQDTYESVLAATEFFDHTVLPEGMSLVLRDALAFCLYVESLNGEDDLYAQIATGENFSDAMTVAMEFDSGCSYFAKFEGVIPSAWNTAYYFRVVDASGNALSPVITYSVASYAVRMMGGEESVGTPLLASMLALHEAALSYEQA